MSYKEKEFKLKDGCNAFLRSPPVDDAENILQFIIRAPGETDFLMKFPEEFVGFTLDQEKAFLRTNCDNKSGLMIICLVDDRITGSRQVSFRTGEKDRHRASVAIALLREFWNLGIGTRMFEEMFQVAREYGSVRQIEPDFMEGNKRTRGLYEKMGFRTTGIKSDAIHTKDGLFANEYMVAKRLQYGGILVRCLDIDRRTAEFETLWFRALFAFAT